MFLEIKCVKFVFANNILHCGPDDGSSMFL
jgi:hypothetical protein